MSMTTELAPEKLEEIRLRYSPKPIPKCHICGAEMSIGAMSASRIVYACSGATYDDAGCHYAPGRSIADDHYAQSRVTVVDVSDPDVLALVEALEKVQTERDEFRNRLKLERGILADADKRIAELEEAQSLHDEGASMLCGQYDELAAAMGWTSELAEKQGVSQLEYARWLNVRIAELERMESALRPVGVMSQAAYHRLENRESRFIALWPRPEIYLPRKRPDDGVIVYARTAGIQVIEGEQNNG